MIHKRVIIALILICCVTGLRAADTDPIVNIYGNWAKSSTKNIQINRCREKSNSKDGMFFHQCTTSYVKVTVKDSNQSGYVIDWYYSDIVLGDAYNNTEPVTKYILQITKGMTIEFSADSTGMFTQILNWGDIKSFMTARADSMTAKFGGSNAQLVYDLHSKLVDLINNKDQIQNVLLQDIQLYYSLYGYTLSVKTPLGYNGFFSDQFGGEPFPTVGAIRLKSVDSINKKFEVVWHQRADSAEERKILKKAFTNQAAVIGKPAPTDADIPNIKIYDDYYFLFDGKTGWVMQLNYKRITATEKMQQTDSVDFKVY